MLKQYQTIKSIVVLSQWGLFGVRNLTSALFFFVFQPVISPLSGWLAHRFLGGPRTD